MKSAAPAAIARKRTPLAVASKMKEPAQRFFARAIRWTDRLRTLAVSMFLSLYRRDGTDLDPERLDVALQKRQVLGARAPSG
jgi:hypothetical protein